MHLWRFPSWWKTVGFNTWFNNEGIASQPSGFPLFSDLRDTNFMIVPRPKRKEMSLEEPWSPDSRWRQQEMGDTLNDKSSSYFCFTKWPLRLRQHLFLLCYFMETISVMKSVMCCLGLKQIFMSLTIDVCMCHCCISSRFLLITKQQTKEETLCIHPTQAQHLFN